MVTDPPIVVEVVEELPSLEIERERYFVAGAVVGGLFAAALGFTLGWIARSTEETHE